MVGVELSAHVCLPAEDTAETGSPFLCHLQVLELKSTGPWCYLEMNQINVMSLLMSQKSFYQRDGVSIGLYVI